MFEFIPAPKPNHKRGKPKRSTKTRITEKVRKSVLARSEGYCERCGKHSTYCMEMAHLVQASQGGRGDDPANVALLCGPSVNTGTCHNFADYTKEGREWRMRKREELKRYYEQKNR